MPDASLTDAVFDPLWVPVLTHYQPGGSRLDADRAASQLSHITPYVRQYLIAGTTGDGWEMSDETLEDWLDLAADGNTLGAGHSFLVGAFAASTEAVIDRAQAIEARLGARDFPARFRGLTLCAPVAADADQKRIRDHFERILAATRCDIAIYQLPQVVQCEIAPETFAALATATDRIRYFKDTSGADRVALSGCAVGEATLLRGAEGDYAAHLKSSGGAYDGWLLSTANGFARQLRAIAEMSEARGDKAAAASAHLTRIVAELFDAAAMTPDGNPFSNANRAVDHLFALGAAWRDAPAARLASGGALPEEFLAAAEAILANNGFTLGDGYLS